MKKKRPKKLIRNILFTTAGLVVVLFLFDLILIPAFLNKTEVTVPNILKLPVDEAMNILEDAGLDPYIGDTVYDASVRKGTILLQKPHADRVVKSGRKIYLVVSGGERIVRVPNILGKSEREARLTIRQAGLIDGVVSYQNSSAPRYTVFKQDIPAGTEIKKSTRIGFTVSNGEGDISIPNLVGKSLPEARNILTRLELRVGRVTFQVSERLNPNTVTEQDPSPGQKAFKGDIVNLFVTKEAEETELIIEGEN